ncbi:MAG: M6 family metalloprotease domain-containing protein [Candidatus Glassbacteria bacterium]
MYPNQGDPGWVRKLTRRREFRRKAARGETSLAALQPERFYLPVLLGNFKDKKGTFSAEAFNNHLFANNPDGTMTTYFNEVSYRQFRLSGDIYGWFETEHPEEYYAENVFPQNRSGYVVDVIAAADRSVDFRKYDNDGPDGQPNSGDDDGYIDAVMVVYPGDKSANSLLIGMSGLGKYEYTTNDLSASGKGLKVSTSAILSELWQYPDSAGLIKVGVACHEFAHVLGLPDLYDYSGLSLGLGVWCEMAEGVYLPGASFPHLSAWCKIQLGWASPIVLEENRSVFIDPVEDFPEIYLVWEDGYRLSRYFLLENRQKIGFDSGLPGSGLLIYHVDEYQRFGKALFGWGMGNMDETHKLVDLEEADGRNDLDLMKNPGNYGDPGDPFPGSSNNTTFNSISNPDSRDYEKNITGVEVNNIATVGSKWISADVTVRNPLGYSICYDPAGITHYGWGPETPDAQVWGGVRFKAEEPGMIAALDVGLGYGANLYEIRIYRAIEDSVPVGLLYSHSGGRLEPGWHSIPFEEARIRIGKNQEFFVAYRTDDWITVDVFSEYTGRSYYSEDGVYFSRLPSAEYGNFNLRARIRTWNVTGCDFNEDGKVDIADAISLLIFLRDNPGDLKADYNLDGRANVLDALDLIMALRKGSCP